MDIKPKKIKIRDLSEGYDDRGDEGVRAYGGRLDVRPPYQREFIYEGEKRDAVITSVFKRYPLNAMYWVKQSSGLYEILDGQQRTISICQYVTGEFSVVTEDGRTCFFHNLTKGQQKKLLDCDLSIYVCDGDQDEKMEWFKIINIAGEELTAQEMRNAVYNGTWVENAKKRFSRRNCNAQQLGGKYVNCRVIRQELLEMAIRWMCGQKRIDKYMAKNQDKPNADDLWNHFESVIEWVKITFPNYRSIMNAVDWGGLYNDHQNDVLDPGHLEERISELIQDSDVQSQKGIYPYLLSGDEKHLNIRSFDQNAKRRVWERQRKKCTVCKKEHPLEEMEGDHITPWSEGGPTTEENLQMLCRDCNRRKGTR